MSLLISPGILPTLKEQDIGAETCHVIWGWGGSVVSFNSLWTEARSTRHKDIKYALLHMYLHLFFFILISI